MILILFQPGNKKERARERADAIDRVVLEVLAWPGVSMAPHQFDAVEFQLDGTEFGHLHRDGLLDVPFVRRIRNALVDDGDAAAHPWVPNSGWVTYQVQENADAEHALYLLRLSYLYRTIVSRGQRDDGQATAPDQLREELEALGLSRRLTEVYGSLLARWLEATVDA